MLTHQPKSSIAKVWDVLRPQERLRIFGLMGLVIFSVFLEALGIGMVVPTIMLITQDDLGVKYPAIQPLLEKLGNPDQAELVFFGLFALVSVYFVKTVYLGFLAVIQMRLIFSLRVRLSEQLYTTYLAQPWTFHLQRNSAKLMRNVLTETHQLVQNGLMPVISLVADCLLLLCIVGLLVFAEPLGALATAATLGIAALLFYGGFRNLVYRWGQERQHHEGLRIQNLQQGLNGTKDVKLLGRERQFLDKFRFHDHATAKAVRNQSVLSQMPRLGLEFLAVLGLVVLVVTMLLQGRQLDSVLPTLGLFAVAAFRMMPSVNKIIQSLQQLKFATPVIDNVHNDLHLKTESIADDQDRSDSDAIELTRTIALENVSFAYDSAQQPALSEVSLDIARGESVGLIGESGSGKSTLVDVILGVLVPTIGNVCVDGDNIHSNVRSWQRRIGYVPQTIFLTDESLRCNIAFGLHENEIDDEAVARAVRAAQLEDFVETLPEGFETVVGERGVRLSGGQRQRIGIARALYHDPDVLVLDEATSALDTETELEVMKAVNALHGDKTIVIVAHRLTTVSRCDRIYRLQGGRIIEQGRPEQVLGESFNSDVENGVRTPTDDDLSSKAQLFMPVAGSGL